MSFVLMNWRLSSYPLSISCWIDQNNHKRFQNNQGIKRFFTGNSSEGKFTYYEYVFTLSENKVCGTKPVWNFTIENENFIFTFAGRVQNSKYPIQSEAEINRILLNLK